MDRVEVHKHFQGEVDKLKVEEIDNTNPEYEENIRKRIAAIVRYAIFSHRWVIGEPTFTNMMGGIPLELKKESGYINLEKFCGRAHSMGYSFAWSDSCCIDKHRSSELDEAIRSMFRWYRHSHICIAYLGQTHSIEDMGQDQWFKRAWTLQELIAPLHLKFYTADWKELCPGQPNDKVPGQLLTKLSTITTIPEHDITDFSPGTDRISEKMSWAGTRRTTHVEDVAYSLIGIFDVSLVIAYGEGRHAFFRLMEAIIQRCNHWDIFAWK
ncbi:hypothetical protein CONPUDRAFT_64787, partial [Coniophora puteana RWD-64-598 SS2]